MTNAAPPYPPMQTGPRSGLLYLRNQVEAYFTEHAVPAAVAKVGLKYRSFSINQMSPSGAGRVVFIPGEFKGDAVLKPRPYGALSRGTRNTASVVNPRELLHWERPFTLSVWGAPLPGDVSGEEGAVTLVEDLLEQVVRAVTGASDPWGVSLAATVTWGDILLVSPPTESSFGCELLVSATQKGPLFDRTLDVVQASPALER